MTMIAPCHDRGPCCCPSRRDLGRYGHGLGRYGRGLGRDLYHGRGLCRGHSDACHLPH